MMMVFENDEELLEFIDMMNKKSIELMFDCIINHASKRIALPDGDVAVVELSAKGFENVFGKKK